MYEYFYKLYLAIADNSSSDLVLFFLILFASITPAYALIYRDRKSSRQHDKERQAVSFEREKEVVNVIKEMSESNNSLAREMSESNNNTSREFSMVVAENTGVISTLKELLLNHGSESKQASARIHEKIERAADRLHERISSLENEMTVIKTDFSAVKADIVTIKELVRQAEKWGRQ